MKNRLRTCVGCRGKFNRDALLKVVRIIGDDGVKTIKFDPEVKLQGRGAWVCANKECIDKAKKSKAFERALKARIEENIYEDLLCV
ncbi:MAG: YlxR family protein [Synergistaceae bacterium]|nr:YlxR family protein [Synergistaceae bacterium]